ncbi:MAG: highly repetitive protein, partial [Pseudonocardia sp.]|nr:highly repetitive protein [Pseudonocardia sp.]
MRGRKVTLSIAAVTTGALITLCGAGVANAAEMPASLNAAPAQLPVPLPVPAVPAVPATPLGGLLNGVLLTVQGLLPSVLGGLVPVPAVPVVPVVPAVPAVPAAPGVAAVPALPATPSLPTGKVSTEQDPAPAPATPDVPVPDPAAAVPAPAVPGPAVAVPATPLGGLLNGVLLTV